MNLNDDLYAFCEGEIQVKCFFLYNKYPECLNFFIAVFIYWDLRIKFCQ